MRTIFYWNAVVAMGLLGFAVTPSQHVQGIPESEVAFDEGLRVPWSEAKGTLLSRLAELAATTDDGVYADSGYHSPEAEAVLAQKQVTSVIRERAYCDRPLTAARSSPLPAHSHIAVAFARSQKKSSLCCKVVLSPLV